MQLSKTQKAILAAGMILVALSVLFPCWELLHPEAPTKVPVDYQAYHFVFVPPEASFPPYTMDTGRLVVQTGIIVVLTAGGILLAARSTRSDDN